MPQHGHADRLDAEIAGAVLQAGTNELPLLFLSGLKWKIRVVCNQAQLGCQAPLLSR